MERTSSFSLPTLVSTIEKVVVVPVERFYQSFASFVRDEIQAGKIAIPDVDPLCIRRIFWRLHPSPEIASNGIHVLATLSLTITREILEEGSVFRGTLHRKPRFTAVRFGKHNIILDDPRHESLPNRTTTFFRISQRAVNSGKYWYVCCLADA